ncbi:RNA polymerase sigma factor [Chitinophaga sancti]|uniref:Sigma-70 family RNA polymerase sigma factor n=1 Tax=Chitinophaga sancti TaxID=1004 RepID=A0ABZ0XNC4_9BACT|nr:sigma-70 family RNA polymerase sigma factor [Chitinophaga sancti]WQG91754.1 sigma-70 family RNA polymerase sigma factor [Chitinophaga sancti]
MEKYPDSQLLGLIKTGNQQAFAALVHRYWEDLYTHIHARLKQEEDTKDVLQEIFITVWKKRDTILPDENGRLGSYLFAAARYCIIDHCSRPDTPVYNEEFFAETIPQHTTISALEILETKEMEEQVNEALNRMPERICLPYRLSRYQQLSTREIALRLSLSEQTVKNNISITLRYLRTYLKEHNDIAGIFLIIVFIIP